ncbi:amidohydrolase family protein [Natronosporangium hydrolyticum]|uniref:D-hydantoinase n=1 Tax=Natronosporangium hydrolyticum TaxID=2811111 RepID=A0A895YGI4_9ACTN|nr:amidohydrolase family protein [Natronosporangium hydrolyticum]QSB16927.1 amidohydrolase family protein [Natronosporangium hydrolyticum]
MPEETEYDLVIRGGTVVTAGSTGQADIGVARGQIAQLGGPMRGHAELDATGLLVLPGAVDMHVHLAASAPEPGKPGFVDTFETGTRAAAAGGVTTVGVMTFPGADESLAAAVAQQRDGLRQQAVVDWIMHPGVITTRDDSRADLSALAQAGHRSFKIFTISLDLGYPDLVGLVAAAGSHGMLTLVHCEDQAMIQFSGEQLAAEGRTDISQYPASRPEVSELAAVDRAIAICELTGSPIYLVHVSSRRALDSIRRARARGLPVYVETRPMYLDLTDEVHSTPGGARFAGQPPLRSASDRAALWDGIADGSIHTLGSDHAPWLLADKQDPALDATTARPGVAELETMLPLLYTNGVATGRIGLERFVALTATDPARLFGLYPQKGTIAVGSDADLVLLDPARARRVADGVGETRADYSIYHQREFVGWPRYTISRGEVVWRDGTADAAAGRGREVRQGPVGLR